MIRRLFFLFSTFSFLSLSLAIPPENNVTLIGDASFKNNTISLTKELNCLSPPSPPYLGVGRAFYINPIRFLDLAKNTTASFSCRFSLSIVPVSSQCPHGDGITFLITSNAGNFSQSNGYMGLPDSLTIPEDSFIAVEFDTSFNPRLGDINGNHIGIDVNSIKSFASIDAESKGVDLRNGKELNAWIEYRDSVKMIRVWAGYSSIRPASPVLASEIDLSKQFKEFMHVGFSASNGQGSSIHTVSKWQFKTFGPPSIPNSMDTVEDGDCFMCSPDEDTSNNIVNNGVLNSHKKKSNPGLIGAKIAGLVGFMVVVIAIIGFFIIKIQRINNQKINVSDEQVCTVQTNKNTMPKRLSLTEINTATMGFNKKRVIGEGASSIVYKGHLPSGETVAIKRFSKINQIDNFSHSFTTEFATMASCLRDKNLVQLYGWCCEGNELVLAYEYLSQGSLDKLLAKSPNFLTWGIRLNIVLDIAHALTYLHDEHERPQVIHGDVKSSNILLDENFTAKLGDFRLSEVYERRSSTRGTKGYLAPEYVYSGIPTVKTDVYSFGVVVLEVVAGRRPINDEGLMLVDWVWDLYDQRRLIEAVDLGILVERSRNIEMERMLVVGIWCAHPNCEKRPTVKEAVRVLRGESTVPVFPARKPSVVIRSYIPEDVEEIRVRRGAETPCQDEAAWLTPRTHFS